MAASAGVHATDSNQRGRERPVWMMPGVVTMVACCFGVVLADGSAGEMWWEAGMAAGVLGLVTVGMNGLLSSGASDGDTRRKWFVRTALVSLCVLLGLSRGGVALHLRAADDLASGLGAGLESAAGGASAGVQRVLTVRGVVEEAELGGPGTGGGGPNPWQADNSGAFRAVDHGTVVLKVSHAGSAGGNGANASGAPAHDRGMQAVTGRIKLALPPGMSVNVGEGIEATGLLLPARSDGVPGQSQAERTARAQAMAGTLVCRDATLLKRAEITGQMARAEAVVRAALAVMRGGAKRLLGLEADGSGNGAAVSGNAGDAGTAERTARRAETDAFIAALLLGEYQPAIRETADRFARLGLLHALSISGFHIAVLAVVAGLVLRAVGVLGRANRLVLVLIVLGYVAMLPAAAPITRSAMTMGVAALVMTLGRQYNQLNLLGFIGAALALANPVDVFTPGFALTFLATGALLRFSGPAAALTQRIGWMNSDAALELRGALATDWTPWPLVLAVARSITAAALIGGMIWLLTAPTILVFSGWLSVLGVLVSLALAPLISLVLVLALLGLLVGGVVQGVAWVIGAAGVEVMWAMEPARAIASLTLMLARAADGIPGVALLLPPFGGDLLVGTTLAGWVPVLWAAAATAGVWVVLECALVGGVLCAQGEKFGRRVPLAAAGAVLAAAITLGLLLLRGDVAATGRGRVDVLELGAGTATLVRGVLNDGSAGVLLIDPGARGPNGCGAAAGAIRRAVRAVGCGQTPTVLLTGATVQKAGAIAELATALGVRRVLLSAAVGEFVKLSPDRPLSQVIRDLKSRGVEVLTLRAGETMLFGDVEVSESAGVVAGD